MISLAVSEDIGVTDPRISSVTDGGNEVPQDETVRPTGYGPRDSTRVIEEISSATTEVTMDRDDERKLSRFNGKSSDDYNLWRRRAVIALKDTKLWTKLQDEKRTQEVKDETFAILVPALGDASYRVCSSKDDEPMEILAALDSRYASSRTCNRITVLTSLYRKRYKNGEDV